MRHPLRTSLLAVAVTVGTAGAFTGPAFADTSTTAADPTSSSTVAPPTDNSAAHLAAIKAAAHAAIGARISSLHFAMGEIGANPELTPADRATLTTTLNGDVAGLTALDTKIQADTTVAQASADYQTIFTGFRVYALFLPQVLFASATDDLTASALPNLTDAQSKLEALLAGPDKSKDTPPVQAAMADLAARIGAATSATNGLSAQVLALTPADFDANHDILAGPRGTLKGAEADVHSARADVAFVLAAIEG